MSGLKPATAFWEVEAPKVLFDLYGDEAAAVLQSWIKHRKDAVVEAMQECVAQGLDPQARVAKKEASFMQRFLDHAKAARKQMGISQSVSMEPNQAPVTSMASPQLVDADKAPIPQDSSRDLSIPFNGKLIEMPYVAGSLLWLKRASWNLEH